MIWHILKTAFGQFRRHRFHTLITVAGLSFGLAACLLIVLFLRHELSYEDHYPKGDRIARVVFDFPVEEGGYLEDCTSPPALGPAIVREMPDVEQMVMLFPPWGFEKPVTVDGVTQFEEKFFFATEHYFDLFDTPFLRGDPETAFDQPDAMILTESAVPVYFGEEDPMGRTVQVRDMTFTVTGIVPDPPSTTHFHYRILARLDAFFGNLADEDDLANDWSSWNFYTYVLLKPGVSAEQVENAFPHAMAQYDDTPEGERTAIAHLQPIKQIHLTSHRRWEIEPNGDADQVRMFALVAGLVLLIACFNTMNLTLARSSIRTREVGVRKSIGAGRTQLVLLFLAESLVLAGIALALSLMFAELALPWFNRQLGTSLTLAPLRQPIAIVGMITGLLLVTLLSGGWPSWVLSRPHPAAVLKGDVTGRGKRFPLRKLLVTFQFAVTVGLIVATGVIRDQLAFIEKRDLGFDRHGLLSVSLMPAGAADAYTAMKDHLLQQANIRAVAASSGVPGGINWTTQMEVEGRAENLFINFMQVDPDILKTLGVEVIEGRGFEVERSADRFHGVVLNEAAAKRISGEVIGRRVDMGSGDTEVIGVVKDFHFRSMHSTIAPFAFVPTTQERNYMLVRYEPGHAAEVLREVRFAWNEQMQDARFEASFLDDSFAKLHATDLATSRLVGGFSLFAILIATLGLMGLSAFTAQRRTKEIAVRKVLGASSRGLVALLAREFFWLVLIAGGIALPLSGWMMARWLEDFAYRTSLNVHVFFEAFLLVLVVAVLTAAGQAFRVIRQNPSASLRHE